LRAQILCDLGDACRDIGELTRAKEHWRRALALARATGFTGIIGSLQARLRSGLAERRDGDSATETFAQ
jgi:hypothetical protein